MACASRVSCLTVRTKAMIRGHAGLQGEAMDLRAHACRKILEFGVFDVF